MATVLGSASRNSVGRIGDVTRLFRGALTGGASSGASMVMHHPKVRVTGRQLDYGQHIMSQAVRMPTPACAEVTKAGRIGRWYLAAARAV
jgi:hypothetical protein